MPVNTSNPVADQAPVVQLIVLCLLAAFTVAGCGQSDPATDGAPLDLDSDVDLGADGDSDSDADIDSDADADSDTDSDADSDADGDSGDTDGSTGPVERPVGCGPTGSCTTDNDCEGQDLCVTGRCEPVRWDLEPACTAYSRGCTSGAFPDVCYAEGIAETCSSRSETIYGPACVSFLELGQPGPTDDDLVMRRLYDLWQRGQSSTEPPRPKVIMAVGDSISESMAYLSVRLFDCMIPGLSFEDGYRVVGQGGVFDTVATAESSETAEWGRGVLASGLWWSQMRPEMATVAFGTNELWSGWQGLEDFIGNMRAIIDALLERNVIPILLTIPPGTFPINQERTICGGGCTSSYTTELYAQAVRDLAAERALPLVDVHQRMLDFDRPGFEPLLADGVHPCFGEDCCEETTCPSTLDLAGHELRDDAVLRMYKWIEAWATGRCPGHVAPEEPAGYSWNDADVGSNFSGAAPQSYCPDPAAVCGG